MSIPSNVLTTTCAIYRPFGSPLPIVSGIACALVPNMTRGRMIAVSPSAQNWTHYMDLPSEVDVRDGCTRTDGSNAITYADGDEVRIPDVSGTRYVVVWVEIRNVGTPLQFKRAYLLRHAAVWPGP